MFKNWQPGDWIALFAIIVPILCASLGAFWLTAKRLGAFETEHKMMKADIVELQGGIAKFAGLDTAMQLIGQGVTTMQAAFVTLRQEIRDDRGETRTTISEMRSETQAALGDIRADVRAALTGTKTTAPARTPRGK